MQKAKKYDWKDSNLALFGSDTEKQVKKESAECEKAWRIVQTVGDGPATLVFRIVKFKIEHWPKEEYGKFYSGDSYIIYNQKPKPDQPDVLEMHIHFWIGKESTQDEYGTAAYKTVELDTLLDDKPIQHREVQHNESELFRSYFDHITYMKGGADTGFRKVTPTEYKPRFFKVVRGDNRKVSVDEITMKRGNLNSDDVFILDNGLMFYQFNGSKCSNDERYYAGQHLASIMSSRSGKLQKEVLDEDTTGADHPFYHLLDEAEDEDDEDSDKDECDGANFTPTLFQLSDAGGSMNFTEVKSGGVSLSDFLSQDVFIYDTGCQLFVWVGGGASPAEKKNGLGYAHSHLMKTQHPLIPITVVRQGQETKAFLQTLE